MLTTLYAIEPLVPEDRRQKLEDLATDLVDRAGRLAGRVHPIMQESLGDLVRAMNCYYSNLIEGTTPIRSISIAHWQATLPTIVPSGTCN